MTCFPDVTFIPKVRGYKPVTAASCLVTSVKLIQVPPSIISPAVEPLTVVLHSLPLTLHFREESSLSASN